MGSNRTRDQNRFRAIPRIKGQTADVRALIEVVEVLVGARSDPMYRALTLADLLDEGILSQFNSGYFIPSPDVTNPNPGGGATVESPTQPQNFTATGGFTAVAMTWDVAAYQGHAYTSIYRSGTNDFGTAVEIQTVLGRFATDVVDPGSEYFYWIRFVNVLGFAGPLNATAGTPAATEILVSDIIQAMDDLLTLEDLAESLQTEIQVGRAVETFLENNWSIEATADFGDNVRVSGMKLLGGGDLSKIIFNTDVFAIAPPYVPGQSEPGESPFVIGPWTDPLHPDDPPIQRVVMRNTVIGDLTVGEAAIQSLRADKITVTGIPGDPSSIAEVIIGVGEITNAQIGNYIQSDNFNPAANQGWRLTKGPFPTSSFLIYGSLVVRDTSGNLIMDAGGNAYGDAISNALQQWTDVNGRPTDLAGIDEAAAAKLLGIEFNATRNNIYVRTTAPTVVPDGPFVSGDIWWNNVESKTYRWGGSSWQLMTSRDWVDIVARPGTLADLDATAAAKLLGIAFNATRNRMYSRTTAPTVGVDGPFVQEDLWWNPSLGQMHKWDGVSAWVLVTSNRYIDLNGRPSDLSDIDEAAATKLLGIDFDATRNNIYARTTAPTVVPDGPFYDGDLWWNSSTGKFYKWDGVSAWVMIASRQYTDLFGRPADLSDIDEAAAAKLLGIPFDATRNNIYVRSAAPTVVPDAPIAGDLWWDTLTGRMYRWDTGTTAWSLMSSRQWVDITGRPATLNDLDTVAAAKLLGVDFNATRNKFFVKTTAPTVGVEGPFTTGDLWWDNNLGKIYKWSGSAWQMMTSRLWTDITGRPATLNDLDAAAAAKLLGIAYDATRNKLFNMSTTPTNPPNGPFAAGDIWWNPTTAKLYTWDAVGTDWDMVSTRTYTDINGRPASLSDVDEAAAAKLLGIDFDATRNNIFVQTTAPTVLLDGPLYTGDLWWQSNVGKFWKWGGTNWGLISSRNWVDILARPTTLNDLDATAAAKLLGVAFDATRNRFYARTSAPTTGVDGPFVDGDIWWNASTSQLYTWSVASDLWQLVATRNWTDINGRPQDLSDLDETAATKLLGIAFDATRNKIFVRSAAPTTVPDGPFYDGDLWWDNTTGRFYKWGTTSWQLMSSQQWVDIIARPGSLNDLDASAAAKLLGVAFNATRNKFFSRTTAPTTVPDGPFVDGDIWWNPTATKLYMWKTAGAFWELVSTRTWTDINGRPIQLSDLDETAAAKLLGIDFDATRNNIYVKTTAPTTVPDGPFFDSDLWWNSATGQFYKWSGSAWQLLASRQWLDINGRPQDLSDLDEAAAAKLLGIDFDATRNNIYVRSTAPTVGVDGPFYNGDLWWESTNGKMYRWDATGNTWQLMASRYWVDVIGRPTTLNNLDETAAAKLLGIDFDATRNNIYTANDPPLESQLGPFFSGDIWWRPSLGQLYKWNGVSAWARIATQQYVDLFGRPSDLSEIDEAAAAKLLGIDFDATRNNIFVRISAPTVIADGPFVDGDLWWDSSTGKTYKWGGSSWLLMSSRQWVDILGRPGDLSEFDETAAAKLFGIDFNATRNNLYTRTSAPTTVPDGPFWDGDLWWNPTTAKLYKWEDGPGWVMMTSRQWTDINGRPSDLSELDEEAATKLLGIPFDATRNNIYVRTSAPTTVPDGPFYSGDLWWNSATGKLYKWQGVDGWVLMSSRNWIDITGRPADLSELDETAAAKLLGIDFDATRNNIYDRATAPLVGVDGPFFEGDLWWESGIGRLYRWDDITEWTLISSRQYTDINGRPSDLSELDELAATKLVGIDFNATRNNIYINSTAPVWDAENPFFNGDIWWNPTSGKMHNWVGTYGVGYYGWAVMATANNFYQQSTTPAGTAYNYGDLWWNPTTGKLYQWNSVYGWLFVADDVLSHFTGVGGINPTNIGTYIANAAVGTLYLQDTVIIVPVFAEGAEQIISYDGSNNWIVAAQANLLIPDIGQATASVALQWYIKAGRGLLPTAYNYEVMIVRSKPGMIYPWAVYGPSTHYAGERQTATGCEWDVPEKGVVWTYAILVRSLGNLSSSTIYEAKMLLSAIKR